MTVPGFRIPLRFLRARYGRTLLTVFAVALGVALVCALDLVTASMRRAFDEVVDTMAGRAALEATAGDGGLVDEALAATIARVPGVELAVPVVQASAFATDGTRETLTVFGVDLLNEDALRTYETRDERGGVDDDPLRFLSDPRSIVLTEAYAARHGLHTGDRVTLDTPRGTRSFQILRLLTPSGVARVYGGNLVVMDIAAAEDAFTQPGLVTRVDVVVARDADVAQVRAAVERVLPPGVRVTTPVQRKLDLQNVMASFGMLLRGIGLLGLVVASLIAFNGVSSEFDRRGWQLGVLAAIGARPRAIWRVQMQEALLIAAASVVLGVALGVLLAHVLLPLIATATALNFKVVAPDAHVVPRAASIAIAALLGIATVVLAAWIPAARSVQLGIASTIRGRGRPPRGGAVRWRGAACLWAAAAGAIALQSAFDTAAFGLAATLLVAVATAASASPLVQRAATAAFPLLVRVAGSSGRLAASGLRDQPRRVGLTTAVIAVGVAGVAWLWILAWSFERSVVDALGRAIRADLVITSTNIGSGFLEAPLDAAALDAVRDVPGIAAAAGWRALEWPYAGETVGLSAYDGEYFRNRRFGEWPLVGAAAPDAWERVARGDGVIVSTSFVASFGRHVGDELVLETPTGALHLPILGVTIDFVAPKGTVEMARDVFVARWRDRSVTRIFALQDPAVPAGDVRTRIAAALGDRFRLRILSAAELLDYFVAQVRRAFAVIPILAVAMFGVILFGLADSLTAAVLDRQREIAVVRAIGLSPTSVRRVVVLESAIVGCVGLALGGVAACILATVWVRHTFQLLMGWSLTVELPLRQLGAIAVALLIVCYVAALWPARRAERILVAEALHDE